MIAEPRMSFADIAASLAPRPVLPIAEELDRLPPLSDEHRRCFLSGGWPRHWRTPPERMTTVKVVEGYNSKGAPYHRTRFQNLEEPGGRDYETGELLRVPIERASMSATLSIVKNMRDAGWTWADVDHLCHRVEAVGMEWLHACPDSDRELWRCWLKAGVAADLPSRSTGQKFVSNWTDQKKVLAYIADNPGLGRNELLKSKAGLDGSKIEGRIKAALVELLAAGLLRREAGSNRSQKHFAAAVSAPSTHRTTSCPTYDMDALRQWLSAVRP